MGGRLLPYLPRAVSVVADPHLFCCLSFVYRCVMQDEDAATDVPEATSTSPAHLGPRRSLMKAGYFVYSIVITVLAGYNAFASGSFSWVIADHSTSRGLRFGRPAVFAMSAVMEASGLASGVVTSICMYCRANDRSLWSDMLCEPYIAAIQGMRGEGRESRTLFIAGMIGIYFQFLAVLITFAIRMFFQLSTRFKYTWVAFPIGCVLGPFIFIGFRDRRNSNQMFVLFHSSLIFAVPLTIEVLEAYYLIQSSASVLNCALAVLDSLAFAPLAVLPLTFILASVLCFLRALIYLVAIHSCPWICEEYIGIPNREACKDCIVRVFERFVTFETAV